MRSGASHVCRGSAAVLLLTLAAISAAAQGTKLSNLDLCNGTNGTPAGPQIKGCTTIIKSNPNSPQILAIAHNNRGNAFANLLQYELAIQDYDESIKLDPNYAKAFNNRGLAYQKQGEYARAIEDFNAAIKIDSNYAVAIVNRGQAYWKKVDYPHALKDFDEAIRLQPTSATFWPKPGRTE